MKLTQINFWIKGLPALLAKCAPVVISKKPLKRAVIISLFIPVEYKMENIIFD